MVDKIFRYVKEYRMIEPEDTIVAGISGGADSVCLLFVLLELRKKIPFRLAVVHVNHKVREDAGRDAAYVKGLCEEHDIRFFLVEEDIREKSVKEGISQEEAGRAVRYQAFEETLKKEAPEGKGKIAVAHNSNDRAETMLFHLFRGTGLTGAGGIRPVNGKIIRPLLCVERKEIEAWLKERKTAYCEDSTNFEDTYTRNRIRHHLLPYAEEQICTGAVRHMNQAAENLQAAEEFVKRQTQAAAERCARLRNKSQNGGEQTEAVLDIPAFLREDEYLQGRILLSLIASLAEGRKDITSGHISDIKKLFLTPGSKQIHLPRGLTVYKKYDMGIIFKEDNAQKLCDKGIFSAGMEYAVSIPGTIEVPGLGRVEFSVFNFEKCKNIPQKTYTKWFDYDKITKSIMFRTRKSGDYLTINSRMEHKSLQDYLVNEKIPKDERDCFYVLAQESHIIWAPGHRISEYFKVGENTRKILQVQACAVTE